MRQKTQSSLDLKPWESPIYSVRDIGREVEAMGYLLNGQYLTEVQELVCGVIS